MPRRSAELTASLRRWQVTASETVLLLEESDRLMDRRVALCRRRRDLLREIVQSATGIVDTVHSR